MKRIIPIVIMLLTMWSTATYGEAPITVAIDGTLLKLDVDPAIIDGRTCVPIRAIFEALGIQVEWFPETQTIHGNKDDLTIEMTVGKHEATVNGKKILMDVPAQIVEGRTLVPVRFLSENVGADVKWDGALRRVSITTQGPIQVTSAAKDMTFYSPSDGVMDAALAVSVGDFTLLQNTYEGLFRKVNGKTELACASGYEVSTDKLTYTFSIRPDARWSDGTPVTAHDFEYAWKRALNPKTESEYAFCLMLIEGAIDYNEGKTTSDKVKINALDDRTLRVVLSAPITHFPEYLMNTVALPVPKKVVEKNPTGWWKTPGTALYNGPFKVQSMSSENVLLVKNENYWNREKVKLDRIDVLTAEGSGAQSAYNAGSDIAVLDEIVPSSVAGNPAFKVFPFALSEYYTVNTKDPVLSDPNVRKALSLAIDRAKVNVFTYGSAATGLVPTGVHNDVGSDFRTTCGLLVRTDITEARRLMEEAGYPSGKGFPELKIGVNSSEMYVREANALKSQLESILGITVTVEVSDWEGFTRKRANGEYHLARTGWVADYDDPMTFLDMFTSWSSQNNTGWSNETYDLLIDNAMTSLPSSIRDDYLKQAEKLLIENSVVLPVGFSSDAALIRSTVKNYDYSPLGYWYFGNAEVIK